MRPKPSAALAVACTASLVPLWDWMATWGPRRVQETPLEEFSRRHEWGPVLGEPSLLIVGIVVAVLGLLAWWLASRRSVVHTFVTLTTTTFLLLGLWLPVASRVWCGAMTTWSDYLDPDFQLAHPNLLVAFIVVPPVIGSVLAVRLRPSRRTILVGLAIGLACALASRFGAAVATTRCAGQMPATDCWSLVYVSFVHVLCACALVAAGSLLVVAAVRRERPSFDIVCQRYIAAFAIVLIPNLFAIDQSFRLLRYLLAVAHRAL